MNHEVPSYNDNKMVIDLLPAQLDMLAHVIKNIYERLRGGYLGKPYKVDVKRYPIKIWREIAKTCASFKADPNQFMEFLFSRARNPAELYPNVLVGDWPKLAWIRAHPEVNPTLNDKDIKEIHLKAEDELLMSIRLTTELIHKQTGETDINSEAALQILRTYCTHIPAYIRCLLGYPDERIMQLYSKDAQKFFIVRPTMKDAAKRFGLPVEEVLLYSYKN
jgi:hypothetical protein